MCWLYYPAVSKGKNMYEHPHWIPVFFSPDPRLKKQNLHSLLFGMAMKPNAEKILRNSS